MKLQKFRAGFSRVVIGITYIAFALMLAMVIIVAVDVIIRKASGNSVTIKGSNELTSFFMIVVCILGIPALQIKNGHVWVSLFVNKFPYRFRSFWMFAIMLIETAIVFLLALGGYRKVMDLFSTGRVTDVLRMPWWIFAVFVLIAFIEHFILSLIDTIQLCADGVKNDPPKPTGEGWSEDEVKGI